jgi:hypothetical protein
MRKLVLSLVGATVLAVGSAASAAVTVDASSMTWSGPTTTNTTTTIGYTDTGLANPFSEWLQFTSDLGGLYSIVASTSSASVNFTSIVLTGPNGPFNLLPGFDNGTVEFWSLDNFNLQAGTYTLTLNGTNSQTGALSGNITMNPVPEPATWAMMLLGFGAVGFAMRRRRRPALMQLA